MFERKTIDDELRWAILKRDHYTCRYCGSTDGPFHIDHVYPVSKGGETSYDNLVTSCPYCNGQKKDRIGIWPVPLYLSLREEFRWTKEIPVFVIAVSLLSLYASCLSMFNDSISQAQSEVVFKIALSFCFFQAIYVILKLFGMRKSEESL